MNQLYYIFEPVPIPGSDIVIVALTKDGSPYGIKASQFIGEENVDKEASFSLLSYFTRLSERGDDAPDLDDLMNSTMAAIIRGNSIYGKGFFKG
jgi:hypothetical protein